MPKKTMPPASLAFLEELRERIRQHGWDGDYDELVMFVRTLYRAANVPEPDLNPYPADE